MDKKAAGQSSVRMFQFDNLKFFLILTVVVGHFCDEYTKGSGTMKSIFIFIYAFHMPLFLLVSGLFHKRYTDGGRIKWGRILSYILVGYALKLLIYAVQLLYGREPVFRLFSDNGIPWFMFVLAVYEIVVYLFRNIKWYYILPLSFLFGCISGYAAWIGDTLYLSRILVFAPFFLAGYYLEPAAVKEFLHKKSVRAVSLVFLLGFAYLCFAKLDMVYSYRYLFTGRHPFANIKAVEGCDALDRMVAYLLSAALCISISAWIPDIKLPLVTRFGSRTLQVYFWHRPILYIIAYSHVMDPVFLVLPAGLCKLLFLAAGVLLTFLLSFRIFGFPVNQLFRPWQKRLKKTDG